MQACAKSEAGVFFIQRKGCDAVGIIIYVFFCILVSGIMTPMVLWSEECDGAQYEIFTGLDPDLVRMTLAS